MRSLSFPCILGVFHMRTFAFVIMAVISLVGAICLEQTLPAGMLIDVLVIIGLVCLAMLSVFGIWLEASWGWALGIIFFAGNIANAVLVYLTAQEGFIPFAVVLSWNVIGIMLCALKSGPTAYEALDQTMQLENIMPPSKKARKSSRKARKTSRKSKRSKR
jgi:hypothetical protein